MSNVQAPNGFVQGANFTGSVPNYAMNPYQLASNNTHIIGYGDVVEQLASGYIDIASGASTTILGIFYGVNYTDSVYGPQFQPSWRAPTTAVAGSVVALIVDDPNAQFVVQCGGTVPILGQADIGANVTFGGNGAPGLNNISTAYIDASTKNTTNTLAFRIMGLAQNVGNDNTSNYNRVIVKMNNQAYNTTTGV